MELGWTFQGGGRVQTNKTSLREVWMFFGTTQFLISMDFTAKMTCSASTRTTSPWTFFSLLEHYLRTKDSNLFHDADLSENMSSFWSVTFDPKLTFWTCGSFTEKWRERNTGMHVGWCGKIATMHVINTVGGCKMCISVRNRQAVKILRSVAG